MCELCCSVLQKYYDDCTCRSEDLLYMHMYLTDVELLA